MCKLAGCDLQNLLTKSFAKVLGESSSTSLPYEFEDSAVLDVGDHRLLMTTDMGPIVGTDIETAGRIAALNSMNDIYARGGIPKWALATLVIQSEHPPNAMEATMKGLLRTCCDEGVEIRGGHTMIGKEAMIGLTVVGVLRNHRLLGKRGARLNDHLFLSKPLGVGMVMRGYALGLTDEKALAEAVSTMTQSNRLASKRIMETEAHAATDVSGFGLLGHLSEMLATGQGARIHLDSVPILSSIRRLPSQIAQTYWIKNNFSYTESRRRIAGITYINEIGPLLDPQTNGGLLVAASESADESLSTIGFACIGQVIDEETIIISGNQ